MLPDTYKDKTFTVEEWLALEKHTGQRFEYHNGRVFPAESGGFSNKEQSSLKHDLIISNAAHELKHFFSSQEHNSEVLQLGVKVAIGPEKYILADLVAVRGSTTVSRDASRLVSRPTLVVEVTSDATEADDRNGKFHTYTSLPSVLQYMVVSQVSPFVTLYNRNHDTDTFDTTEIRGLDADIDLFSVGCVMPMKRLYRKVSFDKGDRFLYSV